MGSETLTASPVLSSISAYTVGHCKHEKLYFIWKQKCNNIKQVQVFVKIQVFSGFEFEFRVRSLIIIRQWFSERTKLINLRRYFKKMFTVHKIKQFHSVCDAYIKGFWIFLAVSFGNAFVLDCLKDTWHGGDES